MEGYAFEGQGRLRTAKLVGDVLYQLNVVGEGRARIAAGRVTGAPSILNAAVAEPYCVLILSDGRTLEMAATIIGGFSIGVTQLGELCAL